MDAIARHRLLLMAGVPLPTMYVPARVEWRDDLVEVDDELEEFDEDEDDLDDEELEDEDLEDDEGSDEDVEEEPDDDEADAEQDVAGQSEAQARHRMLELLGVELRAIHPTSNPAPGRQVISQAGSHRFKLPIGATILADGLVLFQGRKMTRHEATQLYHQQNPDRAPAQAAKKAASAPVKAAKKAAAPKAPAKKAASRIAQVNDPPTALDKAIRRRYESGESLAQIGKSEGISATLAHTSLTRQGVQLRPRGGVKKAAPVKAAKKAAPRSGDKYGPIHAQLDEILAHRATMPKEAQHVRLAKRAMENGDPTDAMRELVRARIESNGPNARARLQAAIDAMRAHTDAFQGEATGEARKPDPLPQHIQDVHDVLAGKERASMLPLSYVLSGPSRAQYEKYFTPEQRQQALDRARSILDKMSADAKDRPNLERAVRDLESIKGSEPASLVVPNGEHASGNDTPLVGALSPYEKAAAAHLTPRDAMAYAAYVRDHPGVSVAEWQGIRARAEAASRAPSFDPASEAEKVFGGIGLATGTTMGDLLSRLGPYKTPELRRIATAVNLPIPQRNPEGGPWSAEALRRYIAENMLRDSSRWRLRSDDGAPEMRLAGQDVAPGHDELHHYWVAGPGLAKWVHSPKPWTTLHALVTEAVRKNGRAVTPEQINNWVSRWFIEVFHYAAGSDKNRVAHGMPPRGHRVGPG